MTDTQEKKNKPEVIREGRLKANIWTNKGENGPYHNIDFARTYIDDENNYQDTKALGQTDLLPLAELARTTYHRVNELKREHRASQRKENNNSHDGNRREQFKAKRKVQNKEPEYKREQ